MTVLSDKQVAMNQYIASQGKPEVSIWEGMGAAADEAIRSGPAMALARMAASNNDRSQKIGSQEANYMYGLQGTEAEIKPDEEMTFDSAEARARDFHERRMNDIIRETVNEDSPIMGNVTQFAASMAASMSDPVLLGANVAGAGLVGAGARALVGSRMMVGIAEASPSLAKGLVAAYSTELEKSLATVVAREGLENFAGSLIEEATIQGALTIGDERMARKYTWQDSIQNIVVGTTMGAGFGTILNKDARKAIASGYLMDWGDDAAEFVKANSVISALEAQAGHEKGRLEVDLMNREKFAPRPWYGNEKKVDFDASSLPTKFFAAVDEQGRVHTFSHRGAGPTLTSDKIHAMNSGAKVIEIDTTGLKILKDEDLVGPNGERTELGNRLMNGLADDVATHNDLTALQNAVELMKNPEADIGDPTRMPWSRKMLRKEISELIKGKTLDEVMKTIGDVYARAAIPMVHPTRSLENALVKEGFDGHYFNGKDFDGNPAYKGVYINETSAKNLVKSQEFDVPKATAVDKIKWQLEQEQYYRKHKDWVQNDAKPLKAGIDDMKEQLGLKKETPLDEAESKVKKDHVQETMASTKEKLSALAKAKESLELEHAQKKLDGVDIDEDDIATLKMLQEIEKGTEVSKLLEQDMEKGTKYLDCIMGVLRA